MSKRNINYGVAIKGKNYTTLQAAFLLASDAKRYAKWLEVSGLEPGEKIVYIDYEADKNG